MPDELTLNETPASSAGEATDTSAASEAPESGAALESRTGLESPAPQPGPANGDTPAAEGEAPGTSEGDLPPFHLHPRWIEQQAKLKEREEELSRLKAWEPIVEQFRAAGLSAPDAVQAAVAQRNEEAALTKIAQGIWAEVEAGNLSEDAAEERFQRIQTERLLAQRQVQDNQTQAQQARAAREGEVAKRLPELARLYPEMDEGDVKEAALRDPGADLAKIAQASHGRAMAVIARYNARAAQRPALAVEGAGGGPSSSGKSVEDMNREEFDTYWKANLARAEAAQR